MCLDPGPHHGRVERLGDEVHRTGLQRLDLALHAGVGGDDDDRAVPGGRIVLQCSTDLIAVHAGHFDIQQDQRGLLQLRQSYALFPAGGEQDLSLILEHAAEQANAIGAVVDDQNHARSIVKPGHMGIPIASYCRRSSTESPGAL
ncbi:hypothetical protein D3C85_1332150 [compost metagenome]